MKNIASNGHELFRIIGNPFRIYLSPLTMEDHVQYSKRGASIKGTRFDPSQFAPVAIDGDSAAPSSKIFQ